MRGVGRWSASRAYLNLFARDRSLVVVATVLAVVQSLALLPVALLVRDIFDTAIPSHSSRRVAVDAVSVLLLYVLSAALSLVTRRQVIVATRRALTRLREQLLARVHGLPLSYFDRVQQSWVHSVAVQDTERLDFVAGTALSDLLPAALVSVGLSAVAVVLSPRLSLVLLAILPLLYGVSRRLARRLGAQAAVWQQASTDLSADLQVSLRTVMLNKVRDAQAQILGRQEGAVHRLAEARESLVWRQSVWSVMQSSVAAAAGVVVLVLGGTGVAQGDSSVGDLLGFYAVLALLLRQISNLLGALPQLAIGAESLHRVQSLVDEVEEDPYRPGETHDFRGAVALRGVTFGYGGEPFLRQVDLTVAPGEHVALIGPNGSGKSTVAALLLGLYRPWSGQVLADGRPYDEIDLRGLRSRTAVVLQDPYLSPGTLRDNICLGRPDATEAQVVRAVTRAGLRDLVDELPEGLDTEIGDEGHLLSGGQRQRVALARALVDDPVLVLLDEPTNHLDHASVQSLHEMLRDLPGPPSIVTITHDPQVAELAGRVVQLRDGKATADATPADSGTRTED